MFDDDRDGTVRPRTIDREIWRLAGPAVVTLAAEPAYLLVDTAIVGRISPEALGGLAVASSVLLMCTGSLIFLTFGTTATVSRLLGAGRNDDAAIDSVQGLWLGLLLGTGLAIVLAVLGDPLVHLFGAGSDVVDEALIYLRISLIGLPALCITMAGTGALRGHLDTRTPLVIAIAANSLNVVLELVLVFGAGWGLAGSAAGTVVAQWCGAVAYVVCVSRLARHVREGATGWARPRWDRVRHHAVIGRDLFIRTVALRAALTLSTALAARRGTIALAGYQIAVQWWTLMAYVTDALEAAAQSLIGRTLGANDRVHARRTARRILGWGLFVGLTLGLLTVVLRSPIAHLFTNEADIIPVVTTSLLWVGAMQPIGSVAYALDGIMVGAGDLAFLARAMIISSVVFAIGGIVTTVAGTGLWGLFLTLGVFMLSRVLLLGWRFLTPHWERTGSSL